MEIDRDEYHPPRVAQPSSSRDRGVLVPIETVVAGPSQEICEDILRDLVENPARTVEIESVGAISVRHPMVRCLFVVRIKGTNPN